MDVILWRHCEAAPGAPDDSRPLTPRGVWQAARVAAWLVPRLPARCRIIVSPAQRARQTADALGLPFATAGDVGTGASVEGVLRTARWPDAQESVLIVGHQPTLGRVASVLLTGSADDRAMPAGGVAWIAGSVRAGRVQVELKFDITAESI